MARAMWKGSISFGLVTIPVSLYPATVSHDLAFKMLDQRSFEPVHMVRTNAEGEAVPWDDVVKGYEYEEGQYAVLSDEDLRRANVEATQTLDIMHFVDADAIDPVYYDTPYYLEPSKPGRKAYALLRETLRSEGRVGVAKVVIRTRQHVAVLRPQGAALVVELLRWEHEIRPPDFLDLPAADLNELDLSKQELTMATTLVGSMVAEWDPSQYHDTYREDVLKMIEEKVASGQTHAITEAEPAAPEEPTAQVVDIMGLLKRSVEQQGRRKAKAGA